jgi:dCTP deaminase
MSVLTREAILRELESGRLRLEPFSLDQVGAASIDLHLGDELRVPNEVVNGPIDVTDEATPEAFTRVIAFEKPYVLAPGHTVHGITRERLFLPPDLCAWIEGRSRIARLGLTVHVSSGFVQPGVSNHQVLEMSNVSGRALAIHPGIRICQIVLQRTEGSAVYRGKFADQDTP